MLADAEQVRGAFDGFGPIRPEGEGDAPDVWRVTYAVDGLAPGTSAEAPVPRGEHVAEFRLPPDYPRLPPRVRLLTPAFHPNVDPATVCVGDHWTAAERLADLMVRVGEMLAYQAYNIRSPLDGEAAMWADLNQDKLPTDARDLRPPALR